jgi:hypothetical protein
MLFDPMRTIGPDECRYVQEAIGLCREHLADNNGAVTFDAVTFEAVIATINNARATR